MQKLEQLYEGKAKKFLKQKIRTSLSSNTRMMRPQEMAKKKAPLWARASSTIK